MNQFDGRRRRLKRIEELVKVKPMTKAEVAEVTGYSRASTWKCFDDLIFRNRVYVSKWQMSAKGYIEQFSFGDLPDVPKPVKGIDDDTEIVIKRARVVVNVRRDPLIAALFGMANVSRAA